MERLTTSNFLRVGLLIVLCSTGGCLGYLNVTAAEKCSSSLQSFLVSQKLDIPLELWFESNFLFTFNRTQLGKFCSLFEEFRSCMEHHVLDTCEDVPRAFITGYNAAMQYLCEDTFEDYFAHYSECMGSALPDISNCIRVTGDHMRQDVNMQQVCRDALEGEKCQTDAVYIKCGMDAAQWYHGYVSKINAPMVEFIGCERRVEVLIIIQHQSQALQGYSPRCDVTEKCALHHEKLLNMRMGAGPTEGGNVLFQMNRHQLTTYCREFLLFKACVDSDVTNTCPDSLRPIITGLNNGIEYLCKDTLDEYLDEHQQCLQDVPLLGYMNECSQQPHPGSADDDTVPQVCRDVRDSELCQIRHVQEMCTDKTAQWYKTFLGHISEPSLDYLGCSRNTSDYYAVNILAFCVSWDFLSHMLIFMMISGTGLLLSLAVIYVITTQSVRKGRVHTLPRRVQQAITLSSSLDDGDDDLVTSDKKKLITV